MDDFQWINSEVAKGKLPKGATELTKLKDVSGGWKAYEFGTGLERFFNVDISGSKSDATLVFTWRTVYDGSKGKSSSDTTPPSEFAGSWSKGSVDAAGGSGKVTLTDFWQKDGKQYAVGSFMWPSGEVDTIALVRP